MKVVKDFDEFLEEKRITTSITWKELVDEIMHDIDDVIKDRAEYDASQDKQDYIWDGIDSSIRLKWDAERNEVFEEWAFEIIDEIISRIK